MINKPLICILITTIFLMSCSHVLPIKEDESRAAYFKRINKECMDEDVTIVTLNGERHTGEELKITAEYTMWLDDNQNEVVNIPTDEIKSITYTDNSIGWGDGAVIGGGILFSLGFTLGALTGPIDLGGGSKKGTLGQHLGLGVLLGFLAGLPGLLLGGIIGGATGADTTFEIN